MDLLFFWASKLLWICISPDSILVALLVITFVLIWRKAHKKASILLGIIVAAVVIITVLPLGKWLLNPLETRFKPLRNFPDRVDGIIVLGGAEDIYNTFLWKQVETGASAERFFAFIHLVRKYPHARHLYTGGTGSLNRQRYKGAQVAKLLFEQQGLDISTITFESASRNTFENAKNSYQLMNPESGENWILITSASHMPRSVGCFNKVGWPVIPYSVDHLTSPELKFGLSIGFSNNLSQLKFAMREWIGLTAYYLTGKTSDFLPKPSKNRE